MGNFLALASVTAAISYILEEVNRDVGGVKITTKPLDAIDTQNPVNGLNIFLYLVTPTSAIDAVDTLIRDNKGQPTNNPILSLDLHYIITATSSENDDILAQKILASAMRILNDYPILSRDLIRKVVRNKEGLESSDLADQADDVRLTLNGLSTDDLTKIWARFPNANFRPSVAYIAQVILLESKMIEQVGVMGSIELGKISQLRSPTIEKIEPQILEYAREASVVIIGDMLRAPSVAIQFNDSLTIPISAEGLSDKKIVVQVPIEIGPGISKVQVIHQLGSRKGEQDILGKRSILKSNSLPFVLAPRILSPRHGNVLKGKELIIEFEPPVSSDKRAFIYLGDTAIPAVISKSSTASGNSVTGIAKINIPEDILPGVYLIRIAIDGASSFLAHDENPRSPSFKRAIGPYVEIT